MVRYITQSSSNRIKICDISDKNFTITTDYVFKFTSRCNEYELTLKGNYCGECAEFSFVENCDGSGDVSLPRGIYKLEVISSLDQTILYKYDQVRVQ